MTWIRGSRGGLVVGRWDCLPHSVHNNTAMLSGCPIEASQTTQKDFNHTNPISSYFSLGWLFHDDSGRSTGCQSPNIVGVRACPAHTARRSAHRSHLPPTISSILGKQHHTIHLVTKCWSNRSLLWKWRDTLVFVLFVITCGGRIHASRCTLDP